MTTRTAGPSLPITQNPLGLKTKRWDRSRLWTLFGFFFLVLNGWTEPAGILQLKFKRVVSLKIRCLFLWWFLHFYFFFSSCKTGKTPWWYNRQKLLSVSNAKAAVWHLNSEVNRHCYPCLVWDVDTCIPIISISEYKHMMLSLLLHMFNH